MLEVPASSSSQLGNAGLIGDTPILGLLSQCSPLATENNEAYLLCPTLANAKLLPEYLHVQVENCLDAPRHLSVKYESFDGLQVNFDEVKGDVR